jgi:hypothetical protein
MLRRILCLSLLLAGCSSNPSYDRVDEFIRRYHRPPTTRPSPRRVEVVLLAQSLFWSVPEWHDEVERLYPDSVMIVCHGGSEGGRWLLQPDHYVRHSTGVGIPVPDPKRPVEDVYWEYRKKYPDKTIVLVACNPGGHRPFLPNCVYATAEVWTTPDRARRPGAVGTIHEFLPPAR